MAFGRKNKEEIKTAETKIWVCKGEECNCWMRDNFKTEEVPTCPICGNDMKSTTEVLQVVDNNSSNW